MSFADFNVLLPRCAALAHNGGVGTCAVAAKTATPQLVVPASFDQPDNARRLCVLGVASVVPNGTFIKRSRAKHVARALEKVLDPSSGFKRRCEALREKIRKGGEEVNGGGLDAAAGHVLALLH